MCGLKKDLLRKSDLKLKLIGISMRLSVLLRSRMISLCIVSRVYVGFMKANSHNIFGGIIEEIVSVTYEILSYLCYLLVTYNFRYAKFW